MFQGPGPADYSQVDNTVLANLRSAPRFTMPGRAKAAPFVPLKAADPNIKYNFRESGAHIPTDKSLLQSNLQSYPKGGEGFPVTYSTNQKGLSSSMKDLSVAN